MCIGGILAHGQGQRWQDQSSGAAASPAARGVPVPAEAQFQAMFSATDMDKNGYIDYVEFVAVMLESSSVAQ